VAVGTISGTRTQRKCLTGSTFWYLRSVVTHPMTYERPNMAQQYI